MKYFVNFIALGKASEEVLSIDFTRSTLAHVHKEIDKFQKDERAETLTLRIVKVE